MADTLISMFLETVHRYGRTPALMARGDAEEFSSITYRQLLEDVEALGLGLLHYGIKPGDRVGLISDNRVEWILADLALLGIGATDVPRGCDVTPQELQYILSHSECKVVLVEHPAALNKLSAVMDQLPDIKTTIVLDEKYRGGKPNVIPFDEVLNKGRKDSKHHQKRFYERTENVKPDDTATIIYTSGTTGRPKGVMLTHANIMSNVRVIPRYIGIKPESVFLSILPPWHVFERTVEYVILSTGSTMAYSRPLRQILLADLAMVRPQCFVSVPRIWEGIHRGVLNNVKQYPPARQRMFNTFLKIGLAYAHAKRIVEGREAHFKPAPRWIQANRVARARIQMATLKPLHRIADKKVFSVIRERTGGKMELAVSGGGALPPNVDEFFDAIGLKILEGYGLTETSPVISARKPEKPILGTVGPPIPNTAIEIRDLEDPEKPPLPPGKKGIVFVRGPQVMKGYFRDPDATERVISEDGWFNTGDIGRMTINGELQLVGRAKDTIVLLGGENIEPAPIEFKLQESRYILQAMVAGQDRKVLTALIVPDFETLDEIARGLGVHGEGKALIKDERIIRFFQDEVKTLISAANGFKPFERISKIRLIAKEFRVGEELTHTLKKRRQVIYDRYVKLIEEMYR